MSHAAVLEVANHPKHARATDTATNAASADRLPPTRSTTGPITNLEMQSEAVPAAVIRAAVPELNAISSAM